jgi:hypothetical protein
MSGSTEVYVARFLSQVLSFPALGTILVRLVKPCSNCLHYSHCAGGAPYKCSNDRVAQKPTYFSPS